MKFNENTIRYLHYNAAKLQMQPENGKKLDTAILNKAFDSIVRDVVLHGRFSVLGDWKPRGKDQVDASFYADIDGEKKLIKLESKCGCGSLKYFTSDGMGGYVDAVESVEDVTDDMLLEKADYVVFALESDPRLLHRPELILEVAYVLPRAQYIEMVHAMSKSGKLHIKIDKAYGQITLQNLAHFVKKTGKWTDRPLQRAYEFIDNCEKLEMFGDFLRRFGRL